MTYKIYSDVNIVLAIYNGENYLPEFLESLEKQNVFGWKLLYRDDGSSDKSVTILENFKSKKFEINKKYDSLGNIGVINNFSSLLSQSTGKYVMLADQDDIWYPDKIATSLAAIQKMEKDDTGKIKPALVFSDLHVVDDNLNITHPSFIKMQGLEQLCQPSFLQLLTQNVAPGCTMIVNRALLDLALPIPVDIAMHDWWLIQVASLFGRIDFLKKPTIAYRQHQKNLVGARSRSLISISKDIFKSTDGYRSRQLKAQRQASAIIIRYANTMNKSDKAAAIAFSNLSKKLLLVRQLTAFRYGLKQSGFLRNFGFYCLM